jgi:hypothetical protein
MRLASALLRPTLHPTTLLLVQKATLQTAEDLLEQLRGASFEAAKRDLEVVQAFAAEQGVTEPLKQVTWHICLIASPGLPLPRVIQ